MNHNSLDLDDGYLLTADITAHALARVCDQNACLQ